MKVKCLNCGKEFEIIEITEDELGEMVECPFCGATMDV